ncbi:YdiU family protein [Nocardioides sp. dk4132]|uniref:protein adenylyltransferase SelO n=1 Tax=unclassified Nocardioides TaxID=2615069 RepID=UPI001296E6FD|nr:MULTISPECIES: YdiU family protein [unclassified Nocardioides]MQW75611.1 YdiU family protein [Nocardioides sp. dk4132]QGA08512.1 YdiU family protein [Nocardioides sp. dk884]
MSTAPSTSLLDDRYARELPELVVPWSAAEAPDPQLLVLDDDLARDLGLDPDWLRTPEGVRFLTGTALPDGVRPVAQAYAGHQFGGYSPRLGDGRALLLGELTDRAGRRRDLHLKGSGRTPFARGGDGLAAVGPMLREHVVSSALHALGVPTTRALAVVATGGAVQRETVLPGAVLARVAASHLRVGTFQYARATDDVDLLRRLADHAIERHHPAARDAEQPYLALLESVAVAQAELVARWMMIGFIHGVLNTDNVTISGESIDFGPCAFLEGYDPATVFSSIDTGGRYAYGNQPAVTQWNLARFAEALLPLIDEDQERAVAIATEALGSFGRAYVAAWAEGMRGKLGLAGGAVSESGSGSLEDEAVIELGQALLELLHGARVDYTSAFRALGQAARGEREAFRELVLDLPAADAWLDRWLALGPDADAMDRVNPVYIPRNHLVEEALDAATEGDLDPLRRLVDAVSRPFDVRPGLERYAAPAPEGFGDTFQTFCGT